VRSLTSCTNIYWSGFTKFGSLTRLSKQCSLQQKSKSRPTKAGEYKWAYDRSLMSRPTTYFLTCANYTSGGEVALLSHLGEVVINQSWGFNWVDPHLYSSPSVVYISSPKSPPRCPSPKSWPALVLFTFTKADGSDREDGRRSVSASREGAASRQPW
jgi:hypothetical protein